ncbi:MAG: TIGR03862 family flavoprotein [Pseudolabrys sp.]|jgi:hypothetical protein
MTPKSKSAAVIGGGPAGLIAAETLAAAGFAVTVYDRMPSFGRKFLMAGRGGLNLTHSEPLPAFLQRYGTAAPLLRQAVEAFPPEALRAWSEALGQDTFVGSSGRVFPKAFKTSPLLRAWLRRLGELNVAVALRHRWTGWDSDGCLKFSTPDGDISVAADVAVLALGGASWPRLGSDGHWAAPLEARGVTIAPLRPSNVGFKVTWSEAMTRFAGEPLKRIAITFGERSARGEAIVTADGIEGGAIYALSGPVRDTIEAKGEARIFIDLRPDISLKALAEKLAAPRGKQSLSNTLRKALKLAPVASGLLHEAALSFGKPLASLNANDLAALIKAVPLRLSGMQDIARAISSAGGIAFAGIDAHFMLTKCPGVFVAGEMLDWEAPTGGYLLQASFATGVAAAKGAAAWLAGSRT